MKWVHAKDIKGDNAQLFSSCYVKNGRVLFLPNYGLRRIRAVKEADSCFTRRQAEEILRALSVLPSEKVVEEAMNHGWYL